MSNSENKAAEAPRSDDVKKEDTRKEEIVLATKVIGTVKWFSVKSGYGFITHAGSEEDVFVHSKRIKLNNPKKLYRTLAEGETVEFDIVQGEKGFEAINVTGPDGTHVRGSQFAANKPRYYRRSNSGNKRRRKSRKSNKGSDSPDGSNKTETSSSNETFESTQSASASVPPQAGEVKS